jgi:hypothetical protein
MPEDELSLWADDRSLDAKLAVLDTQGEFFSLPPLLEEVVWFEPRDSTDQEDRSSDLSEEKKKCPCISQTYVIPTFQVLQRSSSDLSKSQKKILIFHIANVVGTSCLFMDPDSESIDV